MPKYLISLLQGITSPVELTTLLHFIS